MIPQINQQQANLGNVNQAHLMALSQQGNDTLSYAALMEQATAQEAMQAAASENNLQVPKVNFYPSRHPDPQKARRKDIKQAYKLLTPSKKSIINPLRFAFGRKYNYNKQSHVCVIDGCDCSVLIQHDNLYFKFCWRGNWLLNKLILLTAKHALHKRGLTCTHDLLISPRILTLYSHLSLLTLYT